MSDLLHDSHIIRIWHGIAVNALNNQATDIHIEARSQETAIRLRIDGRLTLLNQYPIDLPNWCPTLGHLLKVGLPLPDALRVTAQSSNHWVSHDFSAEIFKHLTRGWPLGESLKRADPKSLLLDVETLLPLHIGAESGALAQMLNKRATTLGSQLSSLLNSLSQSLEPALILLVGAIIGGLVIILYLPIFNLGQIV